MSRSARATLFIGAVAWASACTDSLPPRRQVVVIIDTDALSPEDVTIDRELSVAASIDTVRVDVLDDQGKVRLLREFSATGRLDWPFSFALVPPEQGSAARSTILRIRGFRARDAEPTLESSVPTLSPVPELAIDRVVEIPTPLPESVAHVYVHLSADCLGRPASFGDRVSCENGSRLATPFDAPLPDGELVTASKVGSSELARSVPCRGPARPGRVCIPGGLSILGLAYVAGTEDDVGRIPPLPRRLVRVSPFFIDETEMSVGRAKPLLGRLRGPAPVRRGSPELRDSQYCTLSDDVAAAPLPLNCLGRQTAIELCALEGGRLPTEAEWNHAATGRGQEREYPWGEHPNACCVSSTGRASKLDLRLRLCPGEGVEPVGSHRAGAGCDGVGDVSRDGVLDLGGNVRELIADPIRLLDHPCWGPRFGILVDPLCPGDASDSPSSFATRGGSWSNGPLLALTGMRGVSARGSDCGLRCVYRDDAP